MLGRARTDGFLRGFLSTKESIMAREWVIDDYTGFEGLRLQDCAVEEPGPTDVRIRVEAFALNWGDADLMNDLYSFSFPSFPARVGIEASGIVEAVGSDVTEIEVGERYGTLPYFYFNRGASADTVLIDHRYVAPAPGNLSAVESASVWMQYLTAYYPVVEFVDASPGVNVFVAAGTGTAGNAAIEIAASRGANVIATTRHARNAAYLAGSGANHVFVDDGEKDLAQFILDATDGVGAHLAFDPVGGQYPNRYGTALAKSGTIALYGLLSGAFPEFPIVSMFQSDACLRAYSLFNYVENNEARQRGVEFVYNALMSGDLKPNVDKIYPMEGYIDAWHYLRDGKRETYGKVIINTSL